jgi:hypothetical protein
MVLAACMLFAATGCGSDKPITENGSADTSSPDNVGATGQAAIEEAKKDDGKVSAEEAKKIEENSISQEPPPIQVLTGNTTGYYVNKPTVVVARTAKEWSALKKKHFSHGVKREPIAPVEWGERQVVGLFMPKGKKGDLLNITDVHQEGDTVVVTAVVVKPGEGCKFSGPRPRPFHMVDVRKMEATQTKIILKKQESSPCT